MTPRKPRRPGRVPSLKRQLLALQRKLRREHPELLAVGLGDRRRHGRRVRETTVKLVVTDKRDRLPRSVRAMPKWVTLHVLALGQPVSVQVPTDIVELPLVDPTRFAVGAMRAAALATWRDAAGARHCGVVTAGHGLPAAGAPVNVAVRGSAGSVLTEGRVVARQAPSMTWLDVGLVEVFVPPESLFDVGPPAFPVAEAEEVLELVGSRIDDGRDVGGSLWVVKQAPPISVEAFYSTFPIAYPDGRRFALKNAVVAGAPGTQFVAGSSGSAWTTRDLATGDRALAIQSHGMHAARSGVGTLLASARHWLAGRPGLHGFTLAWRPEDFPP